MNIAQESFSTNAPSRPVGRRPVRSSQGNNFPAPGVPTMHQAPRSPRFGTPMTEIKVTLTRKASPNSARLEYKVIRTMDLQNAQAQVIAAQWQGYTVESYGTENV